MSLDPDAYDYPNSAYQSACDELGRLRETVKALEGERDEATKTRGEYKDMLAVADGSLTTSEALVTALSAQLEGAKEALRGSVALRDRAQNLAERAPLGHWTNTKDGNLLWELCEFVRLAASTLYRLELNQEVRSSNASPSPLDAARHSSDLSAEPSADEGLAALQQAVAAIVCPHAFEHRQGRHQPRQDRSGNRDRALARAREILALPELALARYLRDASADDRHDENLIGTAEREVGRWVYRRIERLMDEAEEGSPEAVELDALAAIVSSIEEYGEEACADHPLSAHLEAERQPEPREAHEKLGEDE